MIIISILEIVFFFSIDTLYAIFITLTGLVLCKKIVFNTYNLLYYPVSTLALSFFALFFLVMPMPATMMEFKPVIYNMHSPINTFTQLLILYITLIIIHEIYKKISHRRNPLRTLFIRIHFFDKLSSYEIWTLIFFSTIYYVLTITIWGRYSEEGNNADIPTGLYLIGFILGGYYQIAPIFFFNKFNIIKQPYRTHTPIIITLTILLFIIGIATNMRTATVLVFANFAFMAVVYILYFPINLKKIFKSKYIVPFLLLAYFFSGPFMDISKAMLVNRGDRYGVSGIDMLYKTFNTLKNKKETKYYKQVTMAKSDKIIWDEEYLFNDVLNRFCSLKILDETLFHAQRIGYSNPHMQKDLLLQIVSVLPAIIKEKVLGENIKLYYTLTDKLYALSINTPFSPGGVKIGTLQGLGLALFGYWYPLILLPVFIIIFFLFDATVFYTSKRMFFSLWFLVNIIMCCYYFSDGHYYTFEIRFIIRSYLESITFYLLTIYTIKKIPFIKHLKNGN